MSTPRIDVAVHFPAIGRSIEPAQLRVLVEDTSAVDAPAILVSQLVLDAPKLDLSTPMVLTFQLPYTGNAADLTVSAICGRREARRPPRRGDLITTTAVLVAAGQPCHVYLVEY